MTTFIDFTVEGTHTESYDCFIVCGKSKFMCHTETLRDLDYFKRFLGESNTKHINFKPICSIPDEYEPQVNDLLECMYIGDLNNDDRDDNKVVSLFYYVGFLMVFLSCLTGHSMIL